MAGGRVRRIYFQRIPICRIMSFHILALKMRQLPQIDLMKMLLFEATGTSRPFT